MGLIYTRGRDTGDEYARGRDTREMDTGGGEIHGEGYTPRRDTYGRETQTGGRRHMGERYYDWVES